MHCLDDNKNHITYGENIGYEYGDQCYSKCGIQLVVNVLYDLQYILIQYETKQFHCW